MLPWLLVHSVVLVIAMPMTNSIKNDWFAMALLGVALVAPAPLLLAAGPIQRRIVRKRLRRLVEHPHFAHAKRFCPICRRELRIDPETERLDADGELCTACGAPMID